MPPSVVPCSPSGPEVDSQYSSGSESQSVHIVAHHPQSESGQGINSEKRKAELVEANDNRAFKAPRSEYHRSHPSKSELDDYKDEDQDDDDDDDDGDEEEEDEDDEEQDGHDDGTPADVGSVNQLFPGPNEPVSGRTTPSAPALHPSLTVPKTAIELFQQMFPNSKVSTGTYHAKFSRFTQQIGALPVKRVPVVSHQFNDRELKLQGLTAFLMQAVGEFVPEVQSCKKCVRHRGVFRGCAVIKDRGLSAIVNGACANCWFARARGTNFCSLATLTSGWVPSHQTPVPVSRQPSNNPTVAPSSRGSAVNAQAPIHPDWAAALAAGPAASTPTRSLAQNSALNNSPAILDRVQVWENRYNTMTTDKLMATQEHLSVWQEDLVSRVMAMNRVVLQRLKKMEDSRGGGR